jgi:hypothetical protein
MTTNQGQSPPLSSFGRGTGLFCVLVVLCGAVGAVLVAEGRGRGAVDLSVCAFGFDPRLDGACALETGAVPGGACFCPRHAGSVLSFPPLAQGTAFGSEDKGDGPPP